MSYPFKWKPLSVEASAKIKLLFEDDSSVQNYVVSEPMGVYGQANLPKIAEKIFNFQVRSDDIWIVTFPKCKSRMCDVGASFTILLLHLSDSKN